MSERRTAKVWQTGYSCGHATRSMTTAEAKEQGYTHYQITGFLDVSGPCPTCKEKDAATRAGAPRRRA